MALFDKPTACYIRDQVRAEVQKYNPLSSINFSEQSYKNMLMSSDRIACCNRYVWGSLPNDWTSQELESAFYDNGSLCIFLDNNDVTISPFTTNGKLNKKGKLEMVQPIGFDGKVYGNKKRCYDTSSGYTFDTDSCIIIQDYTGCIQQDKIIPRGVINMNTTIADEVKTYKLLLYNLVLGINKLIVTCENEEQAKVVIQQAQMLLDPTQPVVAITKNSLLDRMDITHFVDKIQIDDYSRAIDFYNKIRRNFNGVPAPSTFEKKERMISDEVNNMNTATNLTIYDGYMNRKHAVDLINKCFNLNISVKINDMLLEEATGDDIYTDF